MDYSQSAIDDPCRPQAAVDIDPIAVAEPMTDSAVSAVVILTQNLQCLSIAIGSRIN